MKRTHHLLLILGFLILIFNSVEAQPPGQWVWLHGSNTPNAAGNWGTMGVTNATNVPPATYEQCEWADLNGNFWIFGGLASGGQYGGLWKYNPSINQWTWMKGSNVVDYAGSYGVQGVPSITNNPPSRAWGAASWVDSNGNLWMFGGYGAAGVYSDLWKYDIATNTWTWMKGPNTTGQVGIYGSLGVPNIANNPGSRYEASCAWADNAGNLWLFAGYSFGDAYNDLWRYNIATNTWTWMKGANVFNQVGVYGTLMTEAPANTPGARAAYCHWKDNTGNLWMFGGLSGADIFNDLWRYNVSTNNWTWMGGSNVPNATGVYGTQCTGSVLNIPPSRFENRGCWSDQNGNFWMLGGTTNTSGSLTSNDLWKYNPINHEWTWSSGNNTSNPVGSWGTIGVANPANHPDGRFGNVAWGDNTGHLYFYGGSTNPFNTPYNDLWRYSIDPSCGSSILPVAIAVSNDTSVCSGNCATVSATASSGTPSYAYSWTPNIGNGSGPFSVCPSATTTYVAVVTDSAGSTATDSVTVTVNSPPPATLDPSGTTTICNANGIMLNANSGDYHYVWYQDGVIVQSGTNSNYFANSPGVYQVQVVDLGSGCSSMSQTATIVLGGGPVASIITSGGCGSILFNGGSVTLSGTATNAVSYLWSPGGQTTASIQVTQPGTYCVTAFDASGCPSDTPACTTINTTNVQCGHNGQKVILCHVPPGNPNNPQTLCIAPSAVPAHLANHPGDCLGPCSLYYPRLSSAAYDDEITSSFYIAAYPNPFSGSFSLEIFNSSSEPLNLSVYDMLGRVVERYNDVNEKTLVGSRLREGIYFVVAEQGDNMQRLRIVKQ